MAIKIEAGDVKRAEMFLIDPQEIQVDQKANGRWQPHTEADISARADSFEQLGQLEPVTVRRVAGNKVQLVFGYLRHAAALEYNKRHPDSPMKLKCLVVQCNEIEALVRNITENRERKATTPIDDAHAQRRLREEHGYTDTQIAALYKVSPAYVSQLKKLTSLTPAAQTQVHRNELSVSAALTLADLPEKDQKEIVTKAKEVAAKNAPGSTEGVKAGQGGSSKPEITSPRGKGRAANKAVSNAVKEQVREKKSQGSEGTKGARNPSRTIAEIRAVLDKLKLVQSDRVNKLAEILLEYIGGDSTDSVFIGELDSLLGE
jgi:ParB family chromosome partitioning protein